MREAPCRAPAQAFDERRPVSRIGDTVVPEPARIAHHGLKGVDLLRGKDRGDRREWRFDGQADAHRLILPRRAQRELGVLSTPGPSAAPPRDAATSMVESATVMRPSWPADVFHELQTANVTQVAYVPDAGHGQLIGFCHADAAMRAVSLTTEEEGVAMLAGAWLGGQRGALLLQSSGVGNCINMLALNQECRIPLLALVTMRGEWGEFNPWQVPMGRSTAAALETAGVLVYRADSADDVAPTVRAAAALAFHSSRAVAVLIGQRVIGTKSFEK
jgi:sulfopyruvate decarboxylase alpha subunit